MKARAIALAVALTAVAGAHGQVGVIPGGGSSAAPVQILALCSGGPFVAAADTTEQTLATCTVPAGKMGSNGWVQIHQWWEFKDAGGNSTPGTKAMRTKWGGAGAQLAGSNISTGTFYGSLIHLINTSIVTQFTTGDNGAYGSGGNFGGYPRHAVNTAVDQPITFTCQKDAAAENCTLVYYAVQLVIP